MDAKYVKGQRLYVETNNENLEGLFYSMDPAHNRLTLTEIVLHPSGKKIDGFRHYYKNEVIYSKFICQQYMCEVPLFPLTVMLMILRHLQYTVKPF
jgi:hypothetical protein